MTRITPIGSSNNTSNIQQAPRRNTERSARDKGDIILQLLNVICQNPDAKNPAPSSLKDPLLSAARMPKCLFHTKKRCSITNNDSNPKRPQKSSSISTNRNESIYRHDKDVTASSITTYDCSQHLSDSNGSSIQGSLALNDQLLLLSVSSS